jgi:hypothetical protein
LGLAPARLRWQNRFTNLMRIRYRSGRVLEGIILNLTREMARVALRDRDDVDEFRLVGGQWYSEELEPVVFELVREPVLRALLWTEESDERLGSSLVN